MVRQREPYDACMNETNLPSRLSMWIATGLGVGWVVPFPGTIGSLWGLPLVWAIGQMTSLTAQIGVILLLVAASLVICTRAAAALLSSKDPQVVVLDEIVVLPIVFLGITADNWRIWLLGWLIFRVIDISKPPPIRLSERLPTGWGIMGDDCLAGIYSCALLHAALWFDRTLEWGWLVEEI